MKKYILILLLVVLIAPSLALASWWNPLSWRIFNKKTQTPIVVPVVSNGSSDEIQKLKQQIEDLKKQKSQPLTNSIQTKTPENSKTTIKNVIKETVSNIEQIAILRISNINAKVEKEKVTLNWDTNLPSDSRLILDNGNGKVYESENGLGTKHLVEIFNTEPSKEYTYKIIATTADKKSYDDHYGSFIAFIEYRVSLGVIYGQCQSIKIKDTSGRIISGKEVEIRGILSNPVVTYQPPVKMTSDYNGEVRYCNKADTYEISGDGIYTTLSTQLQQNIQKSNCSVFGFCVSA